jgi:uncharacterized membrane protein YeaQ/YmgE (transglycosylase-associated protein family)
VVLAGTSPTSPSVGQRPCQSREERLWWVKRGEPILTGGIGFVWKEDRKMLELFGWQIGMDWAGVLLLVGGALVLGVIAQFIGETRTGYEWLIAGIAALAGGWLGSEAFGTLSTWGPDVGSLYLLPALIGGVVLGGVIDAVVRTMTGGSFVTHPRPI